MKRKPSIFAENSWVRWSPDLKHCYAHDHPIMKLKVLKLR